MTTWGEVVRDPLKVGRAVVWLLGTWGMVATSTNLIPASVIAELGLSTRVIAWITVTGIVSNVIALRVGWKASPVETKA